MWDGVKVTLVDYSSRDECEGVSTRLMLMMDEMGANFAVAYARLLWTRFVRSLKYKRANGQANTLVSRAWHVQLRVV